ncbi:hypothetical protein [Anaeromicropila populeti]|uniref:Uncharacterized protein n=1 Tax=Anaeromicropila populeti TaxID=37658 RepID=A0A1I6IAU5_9FIRM|nr:hypothetical protein [Anaeromicropila populeti]SFR63935.1 hypothetical protein SAMN05661086_00644 [Anaeromicropila populeti]
MRAEEFLEEFQEEIGERIHFSKELLQKSYELDKRKLCQEFVERMKQIMRDCIKLQKEGQKKSIHAICFFCLRHSALTESYEYQINFYDDSFYEDRTEVGGYWEPKYYRPVIQEDIKYFTALLRKRKLRVLDYEVSEFCRAYIFQLLTELPQEMTESIPELLDSEEYKQLEKTECGFYFGEYRERVNWIG